MSGVPPAGYFQFRAGDADVVCLADMAGAVGEAVAAHGTLYRYAEVHPARRAFHGRAAAFAAPLPRGAGAVVVRHAWHGGALRRLTGDLFAPPTRAPRELRTSERLRAAGVRTPQVVAYVRYPAPMGMRRVDVATRLVPDARDLAATLMPIAGDRAAAALRGAWLGATAALLAALARAGARHPDLNLKNVLLAADPAPGGGVQAWVLDVDVAVLPLDAPPAPVARLAFAANFARLRRSLEKWRRTHGLPVSDDDLARLRAEALARFEGRAAAGGPGGGRAADRAPALGGEAPDSAAFGGAAFGRSAVGGPADRPRGAAGDAAPDHDPRRRGADDAPPAPPAP